MAQIETICFIPWGASYQYVPTTTFTGAIMLTIVKTTTGGQAMTPFLIRETTESLAIQESHYLKDTHDVSAVNWPWL